MYTLNYQVTTSTCDSEGRLKLFSALQMMQDCSELWIDSEPAYQRFLTEQGLAQLLAYRQVEVVRIPYFKEKLTVTTRIYDVKPMFGFRNTFIYDEAGYVCYRSYSIGVFVDKETGRLNRLNDEVISACTLDERLPMDDYQDRRILIPRGGTVCQYPAVSVLRHDIDYNRHMNNAHYIRIALELLPADFVVRFMRVEFKTPAKLGDGLMPEVTQVGDAYYVVLRLGKGVSTVMEFK